MFLKLVRKLGNYIDIYHQGTLSLLYKAAPFTRGNLLDIGCGKKPYHSIFQSYVDNYFGIEKLDTFNLTYTSQQAQPDCYYDGHSLPFEDNSFDTVVAFSVLEHTPEPKMLFKEMARVLKVNGVMIQHVPFSYRLHEEPHDYFRFSPHVLNYFCNEHGLAVIDIIPQGGLWSTIIHKVMIFLVFNVLKFSKIVQSVGKLGMESRQQESPRYWLVPFVFPLTLILTLSARILEKCIPIKNDPLAFILIAKKL